MEQRDLEHAYDQVADEYARRIFHELDHKPFDRDLLDDFARRVGGLEPVYDLGCGPGHISGYLTERGLGVTGLDLSASMVDQAKRLNPGIDFVQGDMTVLALPSGSLAGIVAMYSIIHFQPAELPRAFGEMHRVLRSGGLLLVSFHIGTESVHLEEWWGYEVSIDVSFFEPSHVAACLEQAGFELLRVLERDPYPDVEYQSRRSYILARARSRSQSSTIGTSASAGKTG